MPIRKSVAADMFYPADEATCIDMLLYCLNKAGKVKKEPSAVGAVMPHAGWIYSGYAVAKALLSIDPLDIPDTFVILGAVHHSDVRQLSIFPSGSWKTPIGSIEIDEETASAVLAEPSICAVPSVMAHDKEHSIEVNVPFISYMFPKAKLLPIACPFFYLAYDCGLALGNLLKKLEKKFFVIASSDLTHYGVSYGFTSHGIGQEAEKWVMTQNDAELISLMEAMRGRDIFMNIENTRSACGGGAIAACIGACEALGASKGILLEHTNSLKVTKEQFAKHNFVSYASVLFVK